MSSISQAEVLEFLAAVEKGTVVLTPDEEPQDVYAGHVHYKASNGWQLVVFNDANEWDYIESIVTVDGRTADYDALCEIHALDQYEPTAEVSWKRYGIPGHGCFRCVACGNIMRMHPTKGFSSPYRCRACGGEYEVK